MKPFGFQTFVFGAFTIGSISLAAAPKQDLNNPNKANTKSLSYDSEEGSIAGISNQAFRHLDVKAIFTYCMIHAETWSQNCNGMPALLNEENLIYGQPSGAFREEGDWSDRQRDYLHNHRSTVTSLIRDTLHQFKFVRTNLKKTILKIDDTELIPDLISTYKSSPRDLDILSTLSLLMKHGRYKPYTSSVVFKELYGNSSSYQASVPYSAETEELIINNARSFSKKHR